MDDIRQNLWNTSVNADSYSGVGEKYQTAILEQYKMYVEMTDRVSARRGLTNTFFLTLNTAIFTVAAVLWNKQPATDKWLLAFPLVVVLGECIAWFWLVKSYRQLNTAKFMVVGALEERLPASPYWRAEWKALGEGRDRSRYWPLTHLEQWVPILFGVTYSAAFIAVMLT